MTAMLEKHIVSLLQEKDARSMNLIYEHYGGALYGSILQLVKDKNHAQDILQDSLVKIWKNAHRYDVNKARLFTWIFQICRNTALDHLRKEQKKQSRLIQIKDDNVSIIDEQVDYEQHDLLHEKIKGLQPKHQRVLEVVFFKGMTHEQGAEYLNVPLGTFKTWVRQALKELRQLNLVLMIILGLI